MWVDGHVWCLTSAKGILSNDECPSLSWTTKSGGRNVQIRRPQQQCLDLVCKDSPSA